VRQSYLDERKTWFRPDFPLVAPGPINVYNPDHSANVRLLGRETDLCEFFASHLLTRGPVTTLVYGFGGYLLVVAVFTLLFVLGGGSCTNRPESFLSVEHVRVSFFLSSHTMSTVGYGSIYTISDYCNAMMLLQSYINIALLAVITSALFVNFSRPKLGLVFSEDAVLYNIDNDNKYPEIAIQVVKKSVSSMWNTSVQAVLWDYTEFPDVKRVFLPLVQPNVAWMDYGIRIRHVVDDHSPLQEVLAYFSKFGRLPNAFHILVTVSGVHAPTGTPVTSMNSYCESNIKVHRKFLPTFHGRPITTHSKRIPWQQAAINWLSRPRRARKRSKECMEIDLDSVSQHMDEAVVNMNERREHARKKFHMAIKTVLRQVRFRFKTKMGRRLSVSNLNPGEALASGLDMVTPTPESAELPRNSQDLAREGEDWEPSRLSWSDVGTPAPKSHSKSAGLCAEDQGNAGKRFEPGREPPTEESRETLQCTPEGDPASDVFAASAPDSTRLQACLVNPLVVEMREGDATPATASTASVHALTVRSGSESADGCISEAVDHVCHAPLQQQMITERDVDPLECEFAAASAPNGDSSRCGRESPLKTDSTETYFDADSELSIEVVPSAFTPAVPSTHFVKI